MTSDITKNAHCQGSLAHPTPPPQSKPTSSILNFLGSYSVDEQETLFCTLNSVFLQTCLHQEISFVSYLTIANSFLTINPTFWKTIPIREVKLFRNFYFSIFPFIQWQLEIVSQSCSDQYEIRDISYLIGLIELMESSKKKERKKENQSLKLYYG